MKRLLFATFVGFLCAFSAGATTLTRMSEAEMIDQAEVIVAGACSGLESRWLGGTLFTFATITVDEALKGEGTTEVTVAIPGGVDIDRPVPIAVNYPGAPVIAPGQEVVLLLEPFSLEDGAFAVVGYSQGMLEVSTSSGGETLVHRKSGGSTTLTLRQLRELVRSVLDASALK